MTSNLSVLDLFTIGIGPSSSHTGGPMRAGLCITMRLADAGLLEKTAQVEAHLYGSLALEMRCNPKQGESPLVRRDPISLRITLSAHQLHHGIIF